MNPGELKINAISINETKLCEDGDCDNSVELLKSDCES